MFTNLLRRMPSAAVRRTNAIAQQMMHTTSAEPPVLSESNLSSRKYILNRPAKLNALNGEMINLLRPMVEEWDNSPLCGVILGTGVGRAFCAGGDVEGVSAAAKNKATRHQAVEFFKKEFELDYVLATLQKPYVAVCDGITMGGGVGLTANAPFRIATERTRFAMPETRIGYCPDVGASFFLSRLDGEIGTYLALTGLSLQGREVFEHGLATHFVPSRRIPSLLSQLASLDNPTHDLINSTIEEYHDNPSAEENPGVLRGQTRIALDEAFGHERVDDIVSSLRSLSNEGDEDVSGWAKSTLGEMEMRSPTSLVVSLEAVRRGKSMDLREALLMEYNIATAFCNGASPDFFTGVSAVLVEKLPAAQRPGWKPSQLEEVSHEKILSAFFHKHSPFLAGQAKINLVAREHTRRGFGLPAESEIVELIAQKGEGWTVEEIVGDYERIRKRKAGVEAKVREVISRRCLGKI